MTKTRHIGIAKAEPVGEKETAGLVIVIRSKIPLFDSIISGARWYSAQAELLEDALHETLPGGTYDRLLGLMLARKASHFTIAHGGRE